MKKIGLLCLCVFLVACTASKTAAFKDNQGHQIEKQSQAGQWTLVNYWAPWCEGCAREVPELNRLSEQKKLRVLGVSFDEMNPEDMDQFAQKLNIQYPLLLSDPAKAWNLPAADVLPTSYLIDPQGQLKARLLGPQTEQGILKRIADLKQG